PGENKVVVVYKDVTPKTATTDSSSQTDSLPDPICPVPVKPDMTDNGTQTDPKEPGVDGGTLVYKNNFKKIGDNIPQENSSLHQVSHKVAQNSEKRSDKIVSTEKEFPKTGEKQDNMLGLGLASITVAGLIALRMRKRRED
ncbi:LPXTG cell wall anchor domain-containing protein, partial [Enterococcus faecalis]|nr:LPXTG cell wall anchor domain-containing protein [Enterococcus faecalis]